MKTSVKTEGKSGVTIRGKLECLILVHHDINSCHNAEVFGLQLRQAPKKILELALLILRFFCSPSTSLRIPLRDCPQDSRLLGPPAFKALRSKFLSPYGKSFCYSVLVSAFFLMADGALGLFANAATVQPGTSGLSLPSLSLSFPNSQKPADLVSVLRIVILLTVLSLAPAILIMMTSFTRIVVILGFIRQAIGTQQMPPNQLLVGLALFLSFYVMAPTLRVIGSDAVEPFLNEKIDQKTAFEKAEAPLREFMFKQTREKDLELFLSLSKDNKPKNQSEVPTYALVPAFVISELKTAFQIGFMLYLPFLVLDMVVASVLMAMGMMMLPPAVISLPFKILLFVLVDGWELIVGSIVKSFG